MCAGGQVEVEVPLLALIRYKGCLHKISETQGIYLFGTVPVDNYEEAILCMTL